MQFKIVPPQNITLAHLANRIELLSDTKSKNMKHFHHRCHSIWSMWTKTKPTVSKSVPESIVYWSVENHRQYGSHHGWMWMPKIRKKFRWIYEKRASACPFLNHIRSILHDISEMFVHFIFSFHSYSRKNHNYHRITSRHINIKITTLYKFNWNSIGILSKFNATRWLWRVWTIIMDGQRNIWNDKNFWYWIRCHFPFVVVECDCSNHPKQNEINNLQQANEWSAQA